MVRMHVPTIAYTMCAEQVGSPPPHPVVRTTPGDRIKCDISNGVLHIGGYLTNAAENEASYGFADRDGWGRTGRTHPRILSGLTKRERPGVTGTQ